MLMLTRIHAYKLGGNKFQFSYSHGTNFLLVGGHYDEEAEYLLHREMEIMKSHIERYKTKNMFVDIQYVYNDFQIHDKDIPNRSNNNIVIVSKILNNIKNAIYAYRFESNGKWTTINLDDNNYESFQLKSDVVIFPTFDKSVLQEMDESAKKLNANVDIRFLESEKQSLWKQILNKKSLTYNVAKNDVVVSRNDLSVASCYYFNPKNKLITDKKEYDIK